MARRAGKARQGDMTVADASALETMVVVGAVVTALYVGRSIAIPIAIAVLISFSLGPIVSWLRHHRIGRLPAVIIAVVPALLALGAFAYLVTAELGSLADNIPAYETNIEAKIAKVTSSLPSRDMLDRGSAFLRGLTSRPKSTEAPAPVRHVAKGKPDIALPQSDGKPIAVEIEPAGPTPADLLTSVAAPLIGPVSGAALVLLFVVFFLAERENLRDRVIRLAGAKDLHRTTLAMDEAGYRVSRYLLVQTLVNSAFGLIVGLGLFIIGLPNPALWGGIATMLRFIPYLGVAIAAILPLALAFAVDPGWTVLFWTAGLFLSLELMVGNMVEPYLYGSSTGLSAVALVVSAIFWTWLWGTIGLLLATPLTVCIAVIGRYVPHLAFLDILLGNQAPLKPEESFYQRLLAGDPDEATEQAEEFLKTQSLMEFYDKVALPALILAERDRSRGEFDERHLKQVAAGIKIVTENLSIEPPRPAKGTAKAEPGEVEEVEQQKLILCLAGKTDLDEAASMLLAQLLERDGYRAVSLPYQSAIRLQLPDIDPGGVAAVCLSYLDADSGPQARYLARRLKRHLGSQTDLTIALWGAQKGATELERIRAEAFADNVVTTLAAARGAAITETAADIIHDDIPNPTLDALAAQISVAMAEGE